jgi:hypothetical protein
MAITTMDGVVAALGAAQDQKLFFPSATNVAGGFVNLNQAVTSGFGIMAVPGTAATGGTTYNQASFSTGFPKWTANGGGGAKTYMGRAGLTMATAGSVHVYDLCWACSGLVGNVATAQNITSFSGLPTRHSTGNNLEIWVGCSGAIGGTAHNVTVSYTNQAGTAGRTTVSTAGIQTMPANRMYQLPLQSGDTGVQSIQSMTLSISSGTAGNLWLMIMERYVGMSCAIPNVGSNYDFAALGMPSPDDTACLLFAHQGTTTSSGIILGQLDIIQG